MNGSLGTVEAIRGAEFQVRLDDGREVGFDIRQYNHLDHGYAATAHKAQGMTVDRARREQNIRYSTRPPLPENRLTLNEDGTVRLKLKSPWPNGTTHIKLTGPELIERLVALVPPPRVNQIKFYGVFEPNAALRPKIVPAHLDDETDSHKLGEKNNGQYLDWQELMKRVFDLDILVCPRCNSKMQRIAVITEGDVVRRILKSVGLPTAPPKFSPARYPDQTEFWFEETALRYFANPLAVAEL